MVSKGREIENYVDPLIMNRAIKAIYPQAVEIHDIDPFAHRYWYKSQTGEVTQNADKVKIARQVVEEKPNLEILDLKDQIVRLVSFIRTANGMITSE